MTGEGPERDCTSIAARGLMSRGSRARAVFPNRRVGNVFSAANVVVVSLPAGGCSYP